MGLLSVLPRGVVRALRQLMLRQGRKMDPQRMLLRSQGKAFEMSQLAAQHSSAYRTLLWENDFRSSALRDPSVWERLPILTKQNTFGRFSLSELSRDVQAGDLADVLTSSGRGGRSFGFRLTARDQYEDAWFDIDLGLQDVFGVDDRSTLLINCLPMGVMFRSRAVAVANVSVREDMACSILRDVGAKFQQTVLCTDPLFIRPLLAEAQRVGLDWKALNTSVIMGEEMLVEAQRDYIAARMGMDLDGDMHRLVGSSFGVGELGLNLLFETRDTIRIRRAMRGAPAMAALLGADDADEALPSLFCYNPLRSFIEIINPGPDGYGEMCITMLDAHAVIPLPRYTTGDLARLVSHQDAAQWAASAGTAAPWLPMIAVRGRIKDRPQGMPSVESVKECIYSDHELADALTGAFRLSKQGGEVGKVIFQAATDAAAQSDRLLARLSAVMSGRYGPGLQVELMAPNAFPWRPMLDYERKFEYLNSALS